MSFIVQQPHSLTNPTDLYRVVRFRAWADMADGEATYIPAAAEEATFAKAQRVCKELNERHYGPAPAEPNQ